MMSAARFQAMHQGLGATARKVFERVPIAEAWSVHRIQGELERQGVRIEFRVFLGCLKALQDGGLVLEPAPGMLRRAPVRERERPQLQAAPSSVSSSETTMPQTITVPAKQPKVDLSTMDKIGALAARVRLLSSDAAAIATDLETLAIEAGERDQVTAADLERLRTLRSLLREV